MRRRAIKVGIVLLVVAGVVAVAWLAFGWQHSGEPTGGVKTVEGGELPVVDMCDLFKCEKGDLIGRACASVGLPWGKQPEHSWKCWGSWSPLPEEWPAPVPVSSCHHWTGARASRYWLD